MPFGPRLLGVIVLAVSSAWGLGFVARRFAARFGFIDAPDGGRRLHARAVPAGGGWVAWTVFAAGLAAMSFAWPELFRTVSGWERAGFVLSCVPLLVVGLVDDRRRLSSPWLISGALASIALALAFGLRVERLMNPFGAATQLGPLVSVLVSAAWLLACTGSTKFADGIDGLVAGQTVIGAALIVGLCLSDRFYQPDVALLAAVFGGAYLGVLFHGWPRARLFLGEFGSTFAGFGLGVLALISGAKFAIALMAMGFFLVDIAWVMLRRVWRGVSPLEGDRTHLHFVLLAAGLPAWAVTVLLWGLGLGFGVAALQFQTQEKLYLLGALVFLTWGLSLAAGRLAARRARLA